MSKLSPLGLVGLLAFLGITLELDDLRWFRLYGFFEFYPFFALGKR